MKNSFEIHDNILSVTMYNYYKNISFIVSLCDADKITPHRWRYINTHVITTIQEEGLERPATPESAIFESHRTLKLAHRNGDVLDYTRANMSFMQTGKTNTILLENDYAIICLPNAQVAFIDKEDVDLVRPYYFRYGNYKTDSRIDSHYTNENGKSSRLNITRLILGLKMTDGRRAIHIDGDLFNCRKSNLMVINKGQRYFNMEKYDANSDERDSRYKECIKNVRRPTERFALRSFDGY